MHRGPDTDLRKRYAVRRRRSEDGGPTRVADDFFAILNQSFHFFFRVVFF
jgi:hypothetical protein